MSVNKFFYILFFALVFFGVSRVVFAACYICNSCANQPTYCQIDPCWSCIEDGGGYRCVNYSGFQNNCQYSNIGNFGSGSVHRPLPGANTCSNNCIHGPCNRSCNERCASSDTCTGGTTCTRISGNEYRCRRPACSGASDCNCTTPTPTPPPPPPCANIALSVSGVNCNNQITLSISGYNSGTYNFISDAISLPGPTIRPVAVTSVTRTLPAGTTNVTWTHRWRDCNGSSCSPDCVRTTTANVSAYVAPACESPHQMVLSAQPAIIYTDLPFTLNSAYNLTPASAYQFVSDIYAPALNCSAASPAGSTNLSRNCNFIPPVPQTPANFTWTHNWRTVNQTCPNITQSCQEVYNFTGVPNPGYIVTRDGTNYVKGFVNQPRFNVNDDFNSSVFGSLSASLGNHRLINANDCQGNGLVTCSSKGTSSILAPSYSDANYRSDWLATYKQQLLEKVPAALVQNLSGAVTYSQIDPTKTLILISGSLSIPSGTSCTGSKAIVIEGGPLNINPRFINNGDSACMFLVGGATNILNGADNRSTTSSINPKYAEADLDRIDALIITTSYADSDDGDDLLVIKGGVLVQSASNSFRRSIGNSNTPSTIFHYEGARYIKHFKDILGSQGSITIREFQYASLNNP